MKNQRGFSMIELIVTVALLALTMTAVVIGLGALTGQHARECSRNLDAALGQAKNYAMSKSGSADAYMELNKTSDGYYADFYIPDKPLAKPEDVTYTLVEHKRLGKKDIRITCFFEGGTQVLIQDGTSVKFYYDRVSGAFKQAQSGTLTDYCNRILVEKGRKYRLDLVPATGKHTLVRES